MQVSFSATLLLSNTSFAALHQMLRESYAIILQIETNARGIRVSETARQSFIPASMLQATESGSMFLK